MPDALITRDGPVAVPLDYTVPLSSELVPVVLRAVFDGSAAAGAFEPTLRLIAPNGAIVATCPAADSVAAGGSAACSWFPGVGQQATQVIGPGAGCVYYVGPPSGNAATDRAAIQAGHDALPATGGIVQLCRGIYNLGTADPALVFSKPIQLAGHGKVDNRAGTSEGYSITDAATMLQYGSATGVAIHVTTTDTFVLRDFGLVNTVVATPPSAGAGILVDGVLVAGWQMLGISVVGFYRCIDVQQGSEWTMQRCYVGDFVADGIRVQNLTNADYGDMGIVNCFVTRGPHNLGAQRGIHWLSSGGMRVQSCKFNIDGVPADDGSVAIYIDPSAGILTSDLLIEGNSIENFAYGVACAFTPGAGSLVGSLLVGFNEVLAQNTGINLNTSAGGFFTRVAVGGNVLAAKVGGGGTGLVLGNIDNVTYGPNVYDAGLATAKTTFGLTGASLQIGNG